MTTDADEKEPSGPRNDLWRIPRILRVQSTRVRYRPPRPHAIGPRMVNVRDAVEILVRTDQPFPQRALAPALYVGDVALTESETVSDKETRFFAFEPNKLRPGAVIAVGWAGVPRQQETRFRYQPAETRRGRRRPAPKRPPRGKRKR